MTIIRVGATQKYADGWDSAFGKGKKSAPKSAAKPAKKASPKKKVAAKGKKKKK